MSKANNSGFEWQVGETDWNDDVELLDLTVNPARPTPARLLRRLPRRLLALAGLVTLLIAVVIAWRVWDGYQAGFTAIRRDIQATSDLEAWAWVSRDADLSASLISADASPGWRARVGRIESRIRDWAGDSLEAPTVELTDLETQGDLAVVKATVSLPNGPAALPGYSEVRIYERDPDGLWKRTSPDARLWGDERRLTSDNFTIVYRMRDHATVRTFLPRLQTYTDQLARDLSLDPAALGMFEIHIVPTLEVTGWRVNHDQRLTVPSPLLQPTPLGFQPQDRLLRSVAFPLALYLVETALAHAPSADPDHRATWSRVSPALAQWLALDAAPLPSPWQAQLEAEFRRDLASGRQVGLASLAGLNSRPSPPTLTYSRVAGLSLAEYIAQTYGRHRFGAIIEAMPRAAGWNDLTRAALGVEATSLESGWRDWLRARYAPPLSAQ